MANGFLITSNLYPNDNDTAFGLSVNTRSYTFDNSLQGKITPDNLLSTGVTPTNINQNARSANGNLWPSFTDIFYNRIWIIPPEIDLTGAPITFTAIVAVWNAYFEQKTLTSIPATNLTGINLTGPTSKTFNSLETQNYTLALSSSTPSVVDGKYQFIFSNAEDPFLRLFGTLSFGFLFAPDWSNGITERLEYYTNIIESKSGFEQRIRVRKYPRRQIEFTILLADNSDVTRASILRSLYHNQMMFAYGKTWLVPIWHDVDSLNSTLNSGSTSISINTLYRDYNDGEYVCLFNTFEDAEILKISTINSTTINLSGPTSKTWPLGTKIIPVKQCVIGDEITKGSVFTYNVENNTIIWDYIHPNVASTWRTTTYNPAYTYKGYDVYLEKHNFVEDSTNEIYNPQRRLDYATGVFRVDQRFKNTKERTTVNLLLRNRQKYSEFLGFLDYRAGKYKAFWYPTFAQDFQITNSGTSSDSSFICKYVGYSTYIKQNNARKDIIFMKTDGTPVFRRITGSVNNGDGTETITIDQPFGFNWSNSSFEYVSMLRLVRLDSDVIEISHETNEFSQAGFSIVDTTETP